MGLSNILRQLQESNRIKFGPNNQESGLLVITDVLPNAIVRSNFRSSNTLAYKQIPAGLMTFLLASAVSFMQLVNVNVVKGQTNWVKMINIAERINVTSLTSQKQL